MTNSPLEDIGQNPKKRLISQAMLNKTINYFKSYLYADVAEVVMQKELGEEEYKTKSSLQVSETDNQKIRQFCDDNAELRHKKTIYLSYLENKYHGAVAELDGRIIGCLWWFDHRLAQTYIHPHLLRLNLKLAPGEVWSFDLHILKECRGGGISNDFFTLFRKYLKGAGYTKLYGHVESNNIPAVWLHKLQGYKPLKTVKSQLICRALLLSDGQMFLKNPPIGVKQKFDFHKLL